MLTLGEDVLGSPRRWTEAEHQQVEAHPQAGVQILKPIEFASKVNHLILSHHEHVDGSGYPRGLRGEEIPLGARILAVLDAYDAMTAGRPYREPFTPAEALDELRRCSGTQFDPRVVDELGRLLTDTGETAAGDRAAGSGRGGAPRGHARDRDAVR